MVHLALERGYSITAMLVVAAASILLVVLAYRRTFRQLVPSRWWILVGLRVAAIVLVVLLLFRPVLSLETEELKRRSVIFLLDASASMGTVDDASGSSRFDQARSRVLDWSGKLGRDFDVHVAAFAERARALDRPAALASLKPDGEATSLTKGLILASGLAPRRDIEAVLLLSDGLNNTSGDPVAAARRLGIVVHTIGVGNSLRAGPSYRDVRIEDLECPEQLSLDNKARITAHVGQVGLAGHVVKAVLEQDGSPLLESQVELRGGEGLQSVDFEFVPTTKGRHTYTVRFPVLPGEKVAENNHRSAFAQVVEARIRVLYMEGTLRAEYGAIVQRFLSKDPDIEFCALVQTRPNVFVQRSNMEGLNLSGLPAEAAILQRFDVFVVGDLDCTYWKPQQLELLCQRVRAGAGLLMLGGYHSLGPGGYGETALAAILPVFVGRRDIGQITEPFLPMLTPEGQRHPIFANIAKFFPARSTPAAVAGLPPLDGCVRVAGVKPGATILAIAPPALAVPGRETGRTQDLPVLAVQPVGKGRTAVFSGDTTRNWQQELRALDRESPFVRFWGQLVRWLGNRAGALKAEAGITARTDKAYYEPDSPVTVVAVVRDQEGEGTALAQVEAHIHGPGGVSETLSLLPVAGSDGNYAATFEPARPGSYEVSVQARLDRAVLQADKAIALVGRPNLEFDRLDLDEQRLARIARATGGQYVHISNSEQLRTALDREVRKRRIALEQPLYWPGLYWLLFVGLLAAEWGLRRRYQLR
jgi:uncharacterized membrane protein